MSSPEAFDTPTTPDAEQDYRPRAPRPTWADLNEVQPAPDMGAHHPRGQVDRYIDYGEHHVPPYSETPPRRYPA